MPATKEKTIDIDKMVEMAAAIAPPQTSTVFDAALGVGPECLSAENLVHALFDGITDASATHLMGCTTCRENMAAFTVASAGKHSDVVGKALGHKQRDTLVSPTEILPAIIAMRDNVIEVNAEESNVGLTCDVIPLGIVDAHCIDVSGVQATGALISSATPTAEFVDNDHDGVADSLRLCFSDLVVGKRAASALEKNQTVVDTVKIAGSLSCGAKVSQFAGQMRVQLQRETGGLPNVGERANAALKRL